MTTNQEKREIVQKILEVELQEGMREVGFAFETSDRMRFRAEYGLQPGEYKLEKVLAAGADAKEDAINRFVSPLLNLAESAWLYPSISRTELEAKNWPFLIRRGKIYELDLSQDCVTGHEEFWHTNRQERGTIAVVCNSNFDLKSLFVGCANPGIYASKYQLLKGTSGAAIKFAQKVRLEGKRCFLFAGSNGVEHCSLFSPPDCEIADLLVAFICIAGKSDLLEVFDVDIEATYAGLSE